MDKMPPIEQLRGRPIGRVLMKMGLLTREKVHHCLEVQKQRQQQEHKNIPIGEIFVELGLVQEKQLHIALAAQRGELDAGAGGVAAFDAGQAFVGQVSFEL